MAPTGRKKAAPAKKKSNPAKTARKSTKSSSQPGTTKKGSATSTPSSRIKTTSFNQKSAAAAALPSAGLLLTCDPPVKQYIKRLDDLKSNDKKFVIEDLDETHLLVQEKARDEINRKVEDWMNENVWTNIEAKGEIDT